MCTFMINQSKLYFKMKAGINKVIIKARKRRNDEIETNILDQDGNKMVLFKDTSFRPEESAVICGEVVVAPETLGGHEFCREYEGFPVCSGKSEPNVIKYRNLPIEVFNGDKVYFHFHALNDESYLYKEEGFEYFGIDYDQIFCAVRNGQIIPITNYVLVEPYFGDDVEEFDVPAVAPGFAPLPSVVKGKKTASGLIADLHEKPRFLEGVVKYVPLMRLGFEYINVKPGDRIYYTTDSDFENEIEGRNYYVMKLQDIFATNNQGVIKPLGSWVMIDEEKQPEVSESGLKVIWKKKQFENKGKVLQVGPNTKDVKEQNKVIFEPRTPNRIEIEGFLFIKEQDVFCVVE
jgi:co-chaperonin GroES (HSP10)